MHRIVINHCYGGFRLSPMAIMRYYAKKGKKVFFYDRYLNTYTRVYDVKEYFKLFATFADCGEYFSEEDKEYKDFKEHEVSDYIPYENRKDPDLVATIEELGTEASGEESYLIVVPVYSEFYKILDFGGNEKVITPEESSDWIKFT